MQPSMSNVIMIKKASPPAPLRLERGVDTELSLFIDNFFISLFLPLLFYYSI